MSGRSTQKVVKVDEGLWDELDKWLKTEQARKLGYHSKAQVATETIRNFLKNPNQPSDTKALIERISELKAKRELDAINLIEMQKTLDEVKSYLAELGNKKSKN